jgi:hypothetical protein
MRWAFGGPVTAPLSLQLRHERVRPRAHAGYADTTVDGTSGGNRRAATGRPAFIIGGQYFWPASHLRVYRQPLGSAGAAPLNGGAWAVAPYRGQISDRQVRAREVRSARMAIHLVAGDGLRRPGASPSYARMGRTDNRRQECSLRFSPLAKAASECQIARRPPN